MLFTKIIRSIAASALALAAQGAHAHTVQNTPLEKIDFQSATCAPAHEAQVIDAPEENAFVYGEYASGTPINPYRYVDPDGRDAVVVNGRIQIKPVDPSAPKVSIPNNVGAVGLSSKDFFFHTYDVRTSSSLTSATTVAAGIANSPTPGPGNFAASADGTRNNAGSIPMNGDTNMVKSFSVTSPDPSKFTDITVNYTIAGQHGLTEGFVMRFGEIGANGAITLRSYGEGNNWQQTPVLKRIWEPVVNKVWDGNQKEIIKKLD